MSEIAGATHDLEQLIWHRPLPEFVAGNYYDLVFCDGATGAVKHKRWRLNPDDARQSIADHPALHPFAYVCDDLPAAADDPARLR